MKRNLRLADSENEEVKKGQDGGKISAEAIHGKPAQKILSDPKNKID